MQDVTTTKITFLTTQSLWNLGCEPKACLHNSWLKRDKKNHTTWQNVLKFKFQIKASSCFILKHKMNYRQGNEKLHIFCLTLRSSNICMKMCILAFVWMVCSITCSKAEEVWGRGWGWWWGALSPSLFNIFVSDLPKCLSTSDYTLN